MNWITTKIINFMINKNVISNNDNVKAYYKYGIEITISSILNIVLVLLIGIITNQFVLSCIFLTEFIIIRSFSGGLHAETYLGCNLIMCISFIILLLIYRLIIELHFTILLIPLVILSISITLMLAPCDNPHKKIKSDKRIGFKIKSLILVLLSCLIGIILFLKGINIGIWIILICFLISVFLILATIKKMISLANMKKE